MPNIVRDRLKAATPTADHPDANLLTAFAERSLPEPERAAVLEHISRCGDCREVVALALPATEAVAPVTAARPARASWLTWPVLRWGFVAAGVVVIASLGILQVQRRSAPQMIAYKSPEVTVPKSRDQAPAPAAPAAAPAARDDKAVNPAAANSVNSSIADAGEPGRMAGAAAPAASGPAAPGSGKAFLGDAYRTAPSGAVAANRAWGPSAGQWQQNNSQQQMANSRATALNQPAAQISSPRKNPSASQSVEVSGAAPMLDAEKANQESKTRNQSADSQLQFGYSGPVAKAKLPVPLNAFGQVGGLVVDPSGAVVANARITVTPSSTGGPITAVTNAQGVWLVAGLPTGNYKAQAEAPGFNPVVLAFNYDASRPAIHNFTLSPGSVSETVEVAAEQSAVQTESASTANTISNTKVGEVPVQGRNFDQLAELSPGVVPSPRWTINSAGNLQRSFDQGKTWQSVNVNAAPAVASLEVATKASRAKQKDADARALKKELATPVFRAVTATGSEVWAGGSGGALYHSVDAGKTWARVVPASGGSYLTGDVVRMEFPDPQHGTITTSTSEVWVTSDAGQTWKKQ